MSKEKFSLSKRIKSFRFAFAGLKTLFKEEHNSWIHLIAAIGIIIAGIVLEISFMEWIAITIAIGLVFTLEIMNTAIENIADFVSPEKHSAIKKIKDLAAAGVLVSSITAIVIGTIVFLPKLLEKF